MQEPTEGQAPRKAGRPTKLTPELQSKILGLIRAGNHPAQACRSVGISQQTFITWKSKGMASKAKRGVYFNFLNALEQAEAEGEVFLVLLVAKAAKIDAKIALEILARRYAERWAPLVKARHEGEGGGAIQIQSEEIVKDYGAGGGADDQTKDTPLS